MTLTSHHVISDIFDIEHVVQQTGMMHAKNILIDTLREVFSHDRYFKYVSDVFGFPKTPSQIGIDPEDLDSEETTRIFIGSSARYDIKFNPSIIVRNTGIRYKPISFNQNLFSTVSGIESVVDAYGVQTIYKAPTAFSLAGAWDQTFEIKIITEDAKDREELVDAVMIALQSTRRLELQNAGVFVRSCSSAGETEEPYSNDQLYITSINLEVRSEWKIHIPINNVIEKIGLCLTFGWLDQGRPSNNLEYTGEMILADELT